MINMLHSHLTEIAKRLKNPNKYGGASVMVGAGFSKNATALLQNMEPPNWSELSLKMFVELYKEPKEPELIDEWNKRKIIETSGKNVLRLAEQYLYAFGRMQLNQLIEHSICDDQFVPGDLHKRLLELNWSDVFTTNYDSLLERTIPQITIKRNYKVVLNQEDLPGKTRPRIIKLHGSIPHVKPYIICEEDYRTYPRTFSPLVNTVQQAMLETQLCLIGFSGDDPNFLSWLGWLRDNMGDSCPRIFLLGIFDSLSYSEVKLLENRNIVVLDLSLLLEENFENSHYKAIDSFIKILEDYKEDEFDVCKVPMMNIRFEDIVPEKYVEEFLGYTEDVRKHTTDLIAFPVKIARKLGRDLYEALKVSLRLDYNEKTILLIHNLILILQDCYRPLYENEIKSLYKLIEFLHESEEMFDSKMKHKIIFDISLIISETYRIQSNHKYVDLILSMESIAHDIDIDRINAFTIEKAKYNISKFRVQEAVVCIDKVEPLGNIVQSLIKVGLLYQIGHIDEGTKILNEIHADFYQKPFSENKGAGFIGLLNLLARCTGMQYSEKFPFSDNEFEHHEYNARVILNELKSNLTDELINAKKEIGWISRFAPNTYTHSSSILVGDFSKHIKEAYSYIYFMDYFAIPYKYMDHKKSTFEGLILILESVSNPLWIWSAIFRLKDKGLNDIFFDKDRIINENKKVDEEFFDDLIEILNDKDHSLSNRYSLLDEEVVIKMLAKLSNSVDDNRVVKLLKSMLKAEIKSDNNFFSTTLNMIANAVNIGIINKLVVDIFINTKESNKFLNYFPGFKSLEIDIETQKTVLKDIVSGLKSEDDNIRDKQLTTLHFLKESTVGKEMIKSQEEEIAKVIWRKGTKSFPEDKRYLITSWEELPSIEEVNYDSLYKTYLRNPKFNRSYLGKGETIGIDDSGVHNYINNFYRLTPLRNTWKNVILEEEDYIEIIRYIYDFVDNEKQRLNEGIFFFKSKEDIQNEFFQLEPLLLLVVMQVKCNYHESPVFMKMISKLLNLLNEIECSHRFVEILMPISDSNIGEILEDLLANLNSIERTKASSLFTAIDVILYLGEKNISNNTYNVMTEIFKGIRFMSYELLSNLFFHGKMLLNRKCFIDEVVAETVLKELNKLIITEKSKNGPFLKERSDMLYNLSNFCKRYIDILSIEGIQKNVLAIEEIKKYFMTHKLNEVRNIWLV